MSRLFLLAALCTLGISSANHQPQFPTKLELRGCHQEGSPDESQQYVTCSCEVTDWIRNGDGWIAACEK